MAMRKQAGLQLRWTYHRIEAGLQLSELTRIRRGPHDRTAAMP